jgi:hypothetical protein
MVSGVDAGLWLVAWTCTGVVYRSGDTVTLASPLETLLAKLQCFVCGFFEQ